MRTTTRTARLLICLACLLVFAGAVSAGEKKLMHCFYFTAIDKASDAEWEAFFKATDALPGKIPGLGHVWYGKLSRDLILLNTTDPEVRKKLAAGEAATGPVTRLVRQWGVCMEFADEAALKAYATNPAHKDWMDAYTKVRQPGTTTIDFLGK
jgi:hypothetical protein